jgi:hypothetical protein
MVILRKPRIDYSELSFLNLLLFIWQLPQNLIALLICAIVYRVPSDWENKRAKITVMMVPVKTTFCWSLGQFIFINPLATRNVIRHETGHSVQSLYLGPLYLLFVGLPSVILYLTKCFKRRFSGMKEDELTKWYHTKYPENWADKLGRIDEYDD